MTIINYKDKCIGAFVSAAIGDALGWPNENNSHNITKADTNGDNFIQWSRSCGGQYWKHYEVILPGEYSDDTQMLIATARSILLGDKWNTNFTKCELPYWLNYERGGGGALKRAARCWRINDNTPWSNKNREKDVKDYFNAGGNGVAMRILPHVIFNMRSGSIERLMEDVIRNGMYTHGHPRAIVGATCYAYALWFLAHKENKLEYGELVDEVLNNINIWGKLYTIYNTSQWFDVANKHFSENYIDLWSDCVKQISEFLLIAKRSIQKGLLDIQDDVLKEIGCYDKQVNGAGDIAAVSAIYLASKYASNPKQGIKEAAFMFGADTDTIASMVGGLLGMLHGTQWIPLEWSSVQDYDFLVRISSSVLTLNENLDNSNILMNVDNLQKKYDWISTPIGKIRLTESWKNKSAKNINITTTKAITQWGQTIFLKNFTRSIESKENNEHNINNNNKIFKINNDTLRLLTKNPIKNITLNKTLQIIENLFKGDADSSSLALQLNTKEEYVEILKKFIE